MQNHIITDQLLQSNITLLIIEDSESDRVTYSRYLQSDSERTYRIIEAETLGEGLELWRSQRPDIVLIDLTLPDGNGLEFLEAINDNAGEKVPVIVLTGQGNEKMAVRAMKLGAADYLVKGEINAKLLTVEVKRILQEIVSSKQLQRSQQQQILIAEIALRIRELMDLENISRAIVKEVRQFIKADRAIIYQFNPDMSGTVIAEDIVSPCLPCLNQQVEDTCFRDNLGGAYCEGRIYVANDIYAANLTNCHLQLLERFQVRANLVVPILLPNENKRILCGLLILHQCSAPRIWEESDIQLLQQLAVLLAIAIKQAIAVQQVQNELAEHKQADQELLKLNQSLEAKVKERTQELWQVNQLLQTVLDAFPLSVFWKDRQSVLLGCNQLFAKTCGMKSSVEAIGKSVFDFSYTNDEALAYLADDQKVMESGIVKLNTYGSLIFKEGDQIAREGEYKSR
jgi:CheY-like chemotaxis protein